ncbi:hypothetical protein N8E89_24055 (plasmid) [Phyllobacterium sp. A18/5-2]|uniref:hypothetical protein n=1 Tax=Phyllobacterium sp. A18/5-2 TaxID=2978392 RepID=UPI0021C6EDF4|nr:hypothetical protein [Phyllobacterium sp. A18/5-2]UXN66254.1 hypothetical protein N8E89_24055 [Phyllobacterium sp. A18/5-2]
MLLHLFDQLTYSEDDWQIMENAQLGAYEILRQHPAYYENNDRLARTIMKLFYNGERDHERIATIAAHREIIMVRLLSKRH